MDKLSISIVAYNNYMDIIAAINSIEKYTSNKIKKSIYIIDNGAEISLPNDLNMFKKYLDNYSDVTYIDTRKNLGFGKGHNQVLNLIHSEYHAIVNPDILLCEDSFFKIIEWMDCNENIGMTIPVLIDVNGIKQEVYRRELTIFDMFNRMFLNSLFKKRADTHTMQDMDYSKPFQVPFGQGSFLVIRTELFKEIGGFDDGFFMYCEDADLCKRVNQISKLMYFPDTKVIHKWEKGSHKNFTLLQYHIKSMLYYFKKWGWRLF